MSRSTAYSPNEYSRTPTSLFPPHHEDSEIISLLIFQQMREVRIRVVRLPLQFVGEVALVLEEMLPRDHA